MKNIKAFLFDVDGTLIGKDCKMSQKMYATLKFLKENGYYIGINSGRPIFSSQRVMKANNADILFDYYYGSNGIEFLDKHIGEITYTNVLDSDIVKEYANKFNEDFISLAIYFKEKDLLVNHYKGDINKLEYWGQSRFVKPQIYDFNNFEGFVPKMIYLFDNKNIDLVDAKIKSINDDRVDLFYSGKECGEIVPKGASKSLAVLKFSELLNIDPKQIMTFGDAENDIPALLKGTGVIMDYPEIKEKYDIPYMCKDVYEDGIYYFIKEHFKFYE